MTFEIRLCAADEVARISEREAPGADIATGQFARQERGESAYLVAWRGASPVGSGEVLYGETGELRNLHVEPASRRGGIGAALIAEAERVCADRGSTAVRVGVGIGNRDARRLYERVGYVGTGEFETTTYRYVDSDGEHEATETDEWLEKSLLVPGIAP